MAVGVSDNDMVPGTKRLMSIVIATEEAPYVIEAPLEPGRIWMHELLAVHPEP